MVIKGKGAQDTMRIIIRTLGESQEQTKSRSEHLYCDGICDNIQSIITFGYV